MSIPGKELIAYLETLDYACPFHRQDCPQIAEKMKCSTNTILTVTLTPPIQTCASTLLMIAAKMQGWLCCSLHKEEVDYSEVLICQVAADGGCNVSLIGEQLKNAMSDVELTDRRSQPGNQLIEKHDCVFDTQTKIMGWDIYNKNFNVIFDVVSKMSVKHTK